MEPNQREESRARVRWMVAASIDAAAASRQMVLDGLRMIGDARVSVAESQQRTGQAVRRRALSFHRQRSKDPDVSIE